MQIYSMWNESAIRDLERWTEGKSPRLKDGDEVKISLLKPTRLVRLIGVESYDFNFYSNSEGYYRGNTIVRPFQKSGTIYVPNKNPNHRKRWGIFNV